jgi:phosphatidylglycerophosphatase C
LKRLVLIDFDGTITNIDSFVLFTYHSVSIIRLARYWTKTMFKLLFTSSKKAELKQQFFLDNFKNFPEEKFQYICDDFIKKYFNTIIKSSFLQYLSKVIPQDEVVIVSASINKYLKPWCDKIGVKLICTELEIENELLSGYFSTPNCNNYQKVKRIKSKYNLKKFSEIHVFGNSKGDEEMMKLASKSFYNYFK